MADSPSTLRDDRYALTRVLGEGGQAVTFEAVDKRDGRLVAIKRFTVRGASSWKEVELAEREAKVLAAIDHRSIPKHVEHFEEDGQLYLVTEKIEGESLAAIKKRGGRFSESDIVRLLSELGGALDYLHGLAPPVIHRDLKPSNVIQRPDGSFVLIDFGSVRDRLKPEGGSTVVGTFGYMAPEQFQGRAMPGSDVYAAGAMALAMLTGRDPEDLPHKGLAIDVAAALSGARVSQGLVRALRSMLDPDPDTRASQIGPLLAELQSSRRPHPRPAPKPPRERDKPSRSERRAERHQKRRQRRDVRARPGTLPPIFRFFAILGITMAQLAVILSLRVALPLLLTLLSIPFGKSLREAAASVSHAGELAGEAMARAKGFVRGEASFGEPSQARFPSSEPSGSRVRFEQEEDEQDAYDEAAEAEEEAAEAQKWRSSRRRS